MKPVIFFKRRAFSIVELLVAMVVIVVLGSLIIGSTRALLNRADKAVTIGNWRQIGLAMLTYSNENQGVLPGPLTAVQYASYTVTKTTSGSLAYYLAPYIEPGLEGEGRTVGKTYTLKAFMSPATRKASPMKDAAMQFHMNIDIYTEGNQRIYPFGYQPNATVAMRWSAVVGQFQQYGARLSEIPMFLMFDRDARGWNAAVFERIGVMPQPLFGNSRLALYFDGHVGDHYPGVMDYPTVSSNGLSLSGDRK